MNAESIRNFIHTLFGSRLVERLETDLLTQQSQYEQRLNEKDQLIGDLRSEIAQLRLKFTEYESDPSYFWWLFQRKEGAARPAPNPASFVDEPAPDSWAAIQKDWYAQQAVEENSGISNSGREEQVKPIPAS